MRCWRSILPIFMRHCESPSRRSAMRFDHQAFHPLRKSVQLGQHRQIGDLVDTSALRTDNFQFPVIVNRSSKMARIDGFRKLDKAFPVDPRWLCLIEPTG